MLFIVFIVFNLDRDGQLIAAVNLGPTGNTGYKAVNTFSGSQFNQIVLVEKRRPWPDEAHIPLEDAVELGKLVEAQLAQKPSDWGHPPAGILEKMTGDRRRPHSHGAEFRHFENDIAPPDAVGPIQRGTLRVEAYERSNNPHRNPTHSQQHNRDGDIEASLHPYRSSFI